MLDKNYAFVSFLKMKFGLLPFCFVKTIVSFCLVGINVCGETVYVYPANSYFVIMDPIKTETGIALEVDSDRQILFKDEDFFRLFPKIIIGKNRRNFAIARSAAKLNQNNRHRTNFDSVEIWWFLHARDLARFTKEIQAINNANKLHVNTVSTVYLFYQKLKNNVTTETVKNDILLLKNMTKSAKNLQIALEIEGQQFSCSEQLRLPISDLKAIIVGLDGEKISNDIRNLLECQDQIYKTENRTKTKFVVKGIKTNQDSSQNLNEFFLNYQDGSLKVICNLTKTYEDYPCKSIQLINNFANSVNSVTLYRFGIGKAVGLLKHPNRIFCGLRDNETQSWLESKILKNPKVGFSLYFDSKRVNYTTSVLQELIKTTAVLMIENRYELTNGSEVQLNTFLEAYVSEYKKYKSTVRERFTRRTLKLKLNVHPVESRDQEYFFKWTKIAVEATNRANKLSPDLVEGISIHVEKNDPNVAMRILAALREIRRSPEWSWGIKLGLSFPSSLNGCPLYLVEPLAVDTILLVVDLKFSLQCITHGRSNLAEAQSEFYTPFPTCRGPTIVALADPRVTTILAIRITKCKPNWLSSLEIDAQYAILFEQINKLSTQYYDTKVYISSAFDEDPSSEDSCGWWKIHGKVNANGETIIEDRKSYFRRNWRPRNQNDDNLNLLWLWILLPLLLLCLAAASIAVGIIFRYKRKYRLRYEEVTALLNGEILPHNDDTNIGTHADALASKYDKENLEVNSNYHVIDGDVCLGKGEFGAVFRGTVTRNNKIISVAVKITKQRSKMSGDGDVVALRGLVSEIKILSYIGEHPNIVRLIGAYTEKLKQGYVAVFLEFCDKGSLQKHLRNCKSKLRKTTTKTYENEMVETHNLSLELPSKLIRWSKEIVNGMAFLATKHIVHADLATRNVLLNSDFVAKIADFGLSRRMYNYTNYVKSHQEPLPWRWMAPEALQNLEFDEKTDVWAYGITLWEIFTLGDVPYPGLSWDVNFANVLSNGLRPAEPEYNQANMYTLILQCLENNPGKRPTFAQIRDELEEKLNSSGSDRYVNIM